MGCLISASEPENEPSRVNSADKDIAQLKVTRDKIKNYHKKLENNIDKHKQAVKECIRAKNKEKALITLKKQKYLEKTLESARHECLNLEQLIVDLETTQKQVETVQALKQGNELLKQLNQKLVLDDVEKLMEETHEAIEYQNQISEALSQQAFLANEDELLEELDKLDEVEALDYDIPSVPTKKLPVRTSEEECKHEESKQENIILV